MIRLSMPALARAVAALSLVIGLILSACPDADPVILTLNGERVRRSDFERHLAAVEARDVGPIGPEARRGLLDAFLEQRALVIETRRRGLLAAAASAEDEPRAVARLLAEAIHPAEVTEHDIAAFFTAHRAELAVPETVSTFWLIRPTLSYPSWIA